MFAIPEVSIFRPSVPRATFSEPVVTEFNALNPIPVLATASAVDLVLPANEPIITQFTPSPVDAHVPIAYELGALVAAVIPNADDLTAFAFVLVLPRFPEE